MATPAESIAAISPGSGIPPGGVERYVKAIRRCGLFPVGGRGGGKKNAHVLGPHLANVLLSFSAQQPSDGPKAVAALRPLVHLGRHALQAEVVPEIFAFRPGTALGAALDDTIAALASEADREAVQAKIAAGWRCTIWASLHPLAAWIEWTNPNGQSTLEIYGPAQQNLPLAEREQAANGLIRPPAIVRRITAIPVELLVAAGELVQDTIKRQSSSTNSPGMAPDGAVPESESAEAPARASAQSGAMPLSRNTGSTRARKYPSAAGVSRQAGTHLPPKLGGGGPRDPVDAATAPPGG